LRFILIGFGKFGRLSFDRLRSTFKSAKFVIVDPNLCLVRDAFDDSTRLIPSDGIEFLANNTQLLETNLVVPVAPFNIAASYILASSHGTGYVDLPAGMSDHFENWSLVNQSTLCISSGQFICPDDCPEGETCSVTGERRVPMHDKIERIKSPGFQILVVRSFQLLPGVGGYFFRDLQSLRQTIQPVQRYVIATSCKCHAILTSIGPTCSKATI